jgi:hypothetical protein
MLAVEKNDIGAILVLQQSERVFRAQTVHTSESTDEMIDESQRSPEADLGLGAGVLDLLAIRLLGYH